MNKKHFSYKATPLFTPSSNPRRPQNSPSRPPCKVGDLIGMTGRELALGVVFRLEYRHEWDEWFLWYVLQSDGQTYTGYHQHFSLIELCD